MQNRGEQMQKVGAAFVLLALAGCAREESAARAEPVEVEQPGAITAPYHIEPLDGRITVDTQRFEMPPPAEQPAAPPDEGE